MLFGKELFEYVGTVFELIGQTSLLALAAVLRSLGW